MAPFSQSKTSFGRVMSWSKAAASVMTLNVDPGSYSALTARFMRDSAGASLATLGLKRGQLAIAKISPLFGFITITLPASACVFSIAASNLRFAAIERALPRVRHHNDLFTLAANLAVQLVLDSGQAFFIRIDKTQHMSG